jgi:hypothetical protein
MEEQYYADRAQLRQLLHAHPDWPHKDFAAQIERSVGWVKTAELLLSLDRLLGREMAQQLCAAA